MWRIALGLTLEGTGRAASVAFTAKGLEGERSAGNVEAWRLGPDFQALGVAHMLWGCSWPEQCKRLGAFTGRLGGELGAPSFARGGTISARGVEGHASLRAGTLYQKSVYHFGGVRAPCEGSVEAGTWPSTREQC